ncbi:unnamed protein product [Sordaria macrospora k-hell]|uniref:WGS project CABT00000000 data, contig 2.3 n=1 Tax=Sordaria macrospora (strain ATCC MYA-333 / DSM 997 / K(L3346) / K-hell) TaxID=771870 RepID=F7VP97_SORMK|nr:uncharacterized protein SMAC_02334 [Sordaria macrospora k-hell]CCC07325.1 unnamed protein product [Sordaria macrospora k-hell]
MTSSSSTIIRIPRTDTDQEDDFILGEVTHSGTGGSSARGSSKPLNFKIVATEGEEPYALTLKHDQINSLRASSSSCTPTEWESILSSLFITASPVADIEAGAEVESRGKKKSIAITIRRRVAGINQRLGALTLSHSPSSEIQLFDWCLQLAISRQTALSSLSTSAAQVAELEARIADLKSQLEELTRSKVEQETELLQKFRALLNEKKSKIRQQQQELSRVRPSSQDGLSGVIESARGKSGVKVSKNQLDKDEEEEEEEDGGIKIGRIGGGRSKQQEQQKKNSPRLQTRKTKGHQRHVDSPESEPEPSSKTMGQSSSSKTLDVEDDTDSNNDEDEAEEENGKISGRETPDRDDDETASEPDEMDETVEAGEKDLDVGGSPASPPPPSPSRLATRGKGHAASSKNDNDSSEKR